MIQVKPIDPKSIARKVAELPVFPLLAKELSALIPVIVQDLYIDPAIIIKKLADIPVLPLLVKELGELIPDIIQEETVQFASALAHEVRNPLTNINLATEMLQSSLMTAEQKMYVDIIVRGSGRINDLITEFLNAYQPDIKEHEAINMHELLDDVLAMTADRISLKNIRIDKYYTTIDAKVLLHKQKIKIAISNIVINAIDAMPSTGGHLKIVIRLINGRCEVEITDNGIGISKQNLGNIFKPYFTNKIGGMGLGLSTTNETLAANHATLIVKSEEGKGRALLSLLKRY